MGVEVDVVVSHVRALIYEVVLRGMVSHINSCKHSVTYPERRVDDTDVFDKHVRSVADGERDRTLECC